MTPFVEVSRAPVRIALSSGITSLMPRSGNSPSSHCHPKNPGLLSHFQTSRSAHLFLRETMTIPRSPSNRPLQSRRACLTTPNQPATQLQAKSPLCPRTTRSPLPPFPALPSRQGRLWQQDWVVLLSRPPLPHRASGEMDRRVQLAETPA